MTDINWRHSRAISLWRDVLGSGGVFEGEACVARYGPNLSEFPQRHLVASLVPRTRKEVSRIVRIAHRYRVPLYPISRGCNWGMGSKLPPEHGCALVDLSKMNAIGAMDNVLGIVTVEPGVTQGELSDFLKENNIPWMLHVTGAGSRTSVVGNALERGVGMMGHRHRDIRALELVQSSGDVLSLGFDHPYYPEGAGPDPGGLFAQSNFGIVTSMAIALRPRQDVCLFFAETHAPQFAAFIDAIRKLRQERVLSDRTEIMFENDSRLRSVLGPGPKGRWGTWGALYGAQAVRRALREELIGQLRASCVAVTFFEETEVEVASLAPDIAARFALAKGTPSNFSIDALLERFGVERTEDTDLDQEVTVPGMVTVLPAVPLVGERVREIVQWVQTESQRLGVETVMSFSTVNEIAAEGFFRVHFDRRDTEAVARVHRWANEMHKQLESKGLSTLRANVEHMSVFHGQNRSRSAFVHRLHEALDPHGIIAPGRYVMRAKV